MTPITRGDVVHVRAVVGGINAVHTGVVESIKSSGRIGVVVRLRNRTFRLITEPTNVRLLAEAYR